MTGALIILAVTAAVGLLLYLTRNFGKSDADGVGVTSGGADDVSGGVEAADETEATAEACCGRHVVCEKGLLKAEELYYDDEELDRFSSREPGAYTQEEIEEFREVLYTLRPEEVYQWGIALTQRNVPLPDELRDEWIMLCK